ncbi:hypothetical protein QBC38DRAFT_462529 [Podospora fimiseda]|uniref:Uncharacterized protein n=1 Tax=Podospora fimiseda TaxID=252190 RepID=A0AAN7BC98_9PEZI|nr:hypothetical protein QBC38DRAFT_462529 [Podospora fimiseda]
MSFHFFSFLLFIPRSLPRPFLQRIPVYNASFANDVLITSGTFERVYRYTSRSDANPRPGLYVRQYSGMDKTKHFVNEAGSLLHGFVEKSLDGTRSEAVMGVDTGKEMAEKMDDVRMLHGLKRVGGNYYDDDIVRELGVWPVPSGGNQDEEEASVERVFPKKGKFV